MTPSRRAMWNWASSRSPPKALPHSSAVARYGRRDHPLAATTRVSIVELGRHPAVLPGTSTYTGQILAELFLRSGVPLQISMSTNYLETLRMLAAIGLGWSVLPASMLTPELVVLELSEARMQRSLGYVYHRERSLSNAARAFIELLDREAALPH